MSSDVDRLRTQALVEAGLVVAVTVALEMANLRWRLGEAVAPAGSVLAHVLFVLAVSHLLMLVYGSRRAQELKRAYAQRQAAQAQLQHRATHDAVTGLLNRDSLELALGRVLAEGPAALVRFRLQTLEQVTATLGHVVRDELLTAVARRLEDAAQEEAALAGVVVASVQSDEYAVLLPGADEQRAAHVAGLLLTRLREPLTVGSAELEVRALGGVAVAESGGTAVNLLGRADVALLVAATGPTDVVVYRPEIDRRDLTLLNLHGELRHGICAGELRLHHQPKVDLRTGLVTGVEALVRWLHPTRGLLPPSAFLDLAEQTGLIRELTTAVLEQALRDHVAWAAQGRSLAVAVNLSSRSLEDPTLPAQVGRVLARHGVAPSLLELEVTESIAVQDPQQAVVVLDALRAMGVQVAVDDYGTGHSSLTYLSQLPITTLKIDRSFVLAMEASARDLTIVRSTIELAHGLGHRVVAEGLETEGSWRWLQTLDCDDAQGFWLARPVPVEQLLGTVEALEQRLAELPVPGGSDAVRA